MLLWAIASDCYQTGNFIYPDLPPYTQQQNNEYSRTNIVGKVHVMD